MGLNNAPSRKRFLVGIALAVSALSAGAYLFMHTVRSQPPDHPPEKVTIAFSTPNDAVLAVLAQAKGYYRAEGLEAIPKWHPYGKPALAEVLEGKADFATVAVTPVILAIMKGEKISIIATIQTSSKNNAIIARKDKGILTLSGLKGRKIAATLGTTSDFFLDGILSAQGISRKDVQVIDLKVEEMADALARVDIDAISTFNPYLIYAQKKLGGRGITFYDEEIYKWNFNVVAAQEFIGKNPEKVKKVLAALVKAEKFAGKNTAEAQKIVADIGGIDIAVLRDIWADNSFNVSLDQSLILALEDESRWAMSGGLTDRREIPNYLEFIYLDGLLSIKPEAVRILR